MSTRRSRRGSDSPPSSAPPSSVDAWLVPPDNSPQRVADKRMEKVTARFAESRVAAAAARLRPPLIAIVPGTKRPGAPGIPSEIIRFDDACSCTGAMTCDLCLLTHAAEAAFGRRVAHDYLGTCA